MFGLDRCVFCRKHIWPWSRVGWRVVGKTVLFWHPNCYLTWVDINR